MRFANYVKLNLKRWSKNVLNVYRMLESVTIVNGVEFNLKLKLFNSKIGNN